MTSTERILATLAGEPVDRRAVTPVLSLYGARLTGCPLEQYYTDAAAYAYGQAAVRETFKTDALFAPFAFAALGEAFGSEIRYYTNQAPNVRQPAILSVEQWDQLVPPDPDTHPQLCYLREVVRRMVSEHRGELPIIVPLPPPIDLPALVMGMDGWMNTVLFDEDGARRVMDKVTPFFIRLANALLADGAAFVAMPCAFASPTVVTREITVNFARPAMVQALAELRGPTVLHHGGAPMLAHLDLLLNLPSVAGFALDERDSLVAARGIAGSNPVLFGGPMAPRLPGLSSERVEAECRALLESRQRDARFVLYNSGPDIPWETPPENIHALRKAAEAFGSTAP